MALDEVGVEAVVKGLQPYLAAISKMEKQVESLRNRQEQLAASSKKAELAQAQLATAQARMATAQQQATAAQTKAVAAQQTAANQARQQQLQLATQQANLTKAQAQQQIAMQRLAQSQQQMTQTLQQQSNALQRFTNYLGDSTKAAVKFFAAFAVIGIIEGGISALFQAIVGFNSQLEKATISFKTFLGSAEAASQFIRELQQFAAQTPFTFGQAVEQAQRLLAFGFKQDNIIPLLRDVGSFVSALGGEAERFNRVALAIGQIQAKGKLAGEEMRQLAEAGINAAQLLADAFGVSRAEILEASEAGRISAQQFLDVFQATAQERFGTMTQELAKTATGALTTLADSGLIVAAKIFEPVFNEIRDFIVNFASFAQALSENRAALEGIANVVRVLTQEVKVAAIAFGLLIAGMAVARVIAFTQVLVEAIHILTLFNVRAVLTGEILRGLNVLFSTFAGRLALIMIPLIAIDLLLRKFTNNGIIEHLTGEAEATARSTKAWENYHNQVRSVEELLNAGFGREAAVKEFFDTQIKGMRNLTQEIKELQAVQNRSIVGPVTGQNIPAGVEGPRAGPAPAPLKDFNDQLRLNQEELKIWADEFLKAKPNIDQLALAVAATDGKVKELTDAFLRQSEAQRKLAAARAQFFGGGRSVISFDEFLGGKELSGGADDLRDRLNQVVEQLKQGVDVPASVIKALRKELKAASEGLPEDFAALGDDLVSEAKDFSKGVIDAFKNLIPDTDEIFSNWIKRLEIQNENIRNFANNLSYILFNLQEAGIDGVQNFGRFLAQQGPEFTANFARFMAVDPKRVLQTIKPFIDSTMDGFVDQVLEGVLAGQDPVEAATQDSLGTALTNGVNTAVHMATVAAVEALNTMGEFIRAGLRKIANDAVAEQEIFLANALATAQSLGIDPQQAEQAATSGAPLTTPQAPRRIQPPSFTPRPAGGGTRFGDLFKTPQQLADDAAKEADRANKEAERAAREAEQAAEAVARAFEQELQAQLQTLSSRTSGQISNFFKFFATGFVAQAAQVFATIPAQFQQTTVEVTLLTQKVREFNDSLLEIGQSDPITVLKDKILGSTNEFDKAIRSITTLKNFDLGAGFGELGASLGRAIALGLEDAEGPVGDAVKQLIETAKNAVQDSIKFFDSIGDAIITALKNRNQAQQEADEEWLNNAIKSARKEADEKKKAIDDALEHRLDALDKEKEAVAKTSEANIKTIEKEFDRQIEQVSKALDAIEVERVEAFKIDVDRALQPIEDALEVSLRASDARIEALEAEKEAVRRLAEERKSELELDKLQARRKSIADRLSDPNLSAAARRSLQRQVGTLDKEIGEKEQERADQRRIDAIDDQINSLRRQQQTERQISEDRTQAERNRLEDLNKLYEENAKRQNELAQEQAENDRKLLEEKKKRLEEEKEAAIEAARVIAEAEKKHIEEEEKNIRRAAETRKEALDEQLSDTLENLDDQLEAIRKFFEQINDPTNLRNTSIQLIVSGNQQEILQLLNEFNPDWQNAGQSFGESLILGLQSQQVPMETAVTQAFNLFKESKDIIASLLSAGSANAQTYGEGYVTQLPTEFQEMTQSTITQLQTMAANTQPPAFEAGGKIGISFGDGMVEGIRVRTPQLAAAIKEALLKGVQEAQIILDANSPSRLTRDLIGKPIGEGIAEGVRDSIPEIMKAMTEATGAITGFQNATMVSVPSAGFVSVLPASGQSGTSSTGTASQVLQSGDTYNVHNEWHVQAWDTQDIIRNRNKLQRGIDQGMQLNRAGRLGNGK